MNPSSIDTFGAAPQNITDAYILWVLSSLEDYSYDLLKEEYSNLIAVGDVSNDP